MLTDDMLYHRTCLQVTDPYLNLFRGIVPPLLGTIDFTPLLGKISLHPAVSESCWYPQSSDVSNTAWKSMHQFNTHVCLVCSSHFSAISPGSDCRAAAGCTCSALVNNEKHSHIYGWNCRMKSGCADPLIVVIHAGFFILQFLAGALDLGYEEDSW